MIIDLPELLGSGTIRLASYPPEMTLAEKIITMMTRRELNTRDRDFADVWVISRSLTLTANELRSAVAAVAEHREQEVVPLASALTDMPDRQALHRDAQSHGLPAPPSKPVEPAARRGR